MHIIGVDPHPKSHTAVAMDGAGKILSTQTFANDAQGLSSFLKWLEGYEERVIGIEGAGNKFVLEWVSGLLAEGERVISVSPALTSQYRSRRGRKKNDLVDAEQVGRVVWANPELSDYQITQALQSLKDLSRTYQRLSSQYKSNCMAQKDLPPQLAQQLQGLLRELKTLLKQLKSQMRPLILQLCPVLLEESGLDVVLSAQLLAETTGIQRFANADRFALYCGAAPLERSSGQSHRVQVNSGNNRKLNRVMYLVALTRLKQHPPTRSLFEKQLSKGKSKRAAFRVLKTYIARSLFFVLKEGKNRVSKQTVRDMKKALQQQPKVA